jgi:uncharacterized Zn finger protein (UPF0148 family)
MFKNLLSELDRLKNTTSVSVPLEKDAEGYYDKECPAEACLFGFKVFGDDWTDKVSDDEVFCPSCRHTASSKSWYPREQIEKAREHALNQIKGRINSAMRQDATDWNRRQSRSSFISITMNVTGGGSAILLPVAAADPMRLKTTCESCGCRYSYIGAAFFCPACGTNSAHQTFQQTLNTIRAAAGSKPTLSAVLDQDQTETLFRSLLEKGFQDTVTAFQRLAEQLFAEVPGTNPPRRNAFQSLETGSELWKNVAGKSYGEILSSEDLAKLKIYFRQRHLLAHCQGIVDEDYVLKSGDATYAVGQRLMLSEETLLAFAAIIEKLGGELIEATNAAKAP